MAEITLTIDDTNLPIIAKALGYKAKVIVDGVEVDNPQGRRAYIKECVHKFIKREVKIFEGDLAVAAARTAKEVEIENTILIT